MSDLGPEWIPDQDGIPFRRAARVAVFDEDGKLLLVRGHDSENVRRSWWFTTGGGQEEGETLQQTAVREIREETGIALDPTRLVGPVLHRRALFGFLNVTARQEEWFFVAHVHRTELNWDGWTELERSVLDAMTWWDLDDLEVEARRAEVYPRDLVAMARQWKDGWDGTMIELDESSVG